MDTLDNSLRESTEAMCHAIRRLRSAPMGYTPGMRTRNSFTELTNTNTSGPK